MLVPHPIFARFSLLPRWVISHIVMELLLRLLLHLVGILAGVDLEIVVGLGQRMRIAGGLRGYTEVWRVSALLSQRLGILSIVGTCKVIVEIIILVYPLIVDDLNVAVGGTRILHLVWRLIGNLQAVVIHFGTELDLYILLRFFFRTFLPGKLWRHMASLDMLGDYGVAEVLLTFEALDEVTLLEMFQQIHVEDFLMALRAVHEDIPALPSVLVLLF